MLITRFALYVAATVFSTASFANELKPLFRYDDYPPEAVRHNWQGEVTVDLTISPEGRATSCSVIKSSGHQVLDDVTCRIFLTRAKFKPMIGANGQPIETHLVPDPIGWHLHP